MVEGLEEKPCEEWLKLLDLFGLEETKENLIVYSFLTRVGSGASTYIFSVVTSDST